MGSPLGVQPKGLRDSEPPSAHYQVCHVPVQAGVLWRITPRFRHFCWIFRAAPVITRKGRVVRSPVARHALTRTGGRSMWSPFTSRRWLARGLRIALFAGVGWWLLQQSGWLAHAELPWEEEWPRTDFSHRSVALTEIVSGGPRKDGIPAIDRPRFVPPEEAPRWLDPQEPVVVLEGAVTGWACPLQVLIWHEIVNDRFPGIPVAVTFVPCATPPSSSTGGWMGWAWTARSATVACWSARPAPSGSVWDGYLGAAGRRAASRPGQRSPFRLCMAGLQAGFRDLQTLNLETAVDRSVETYRIES